VPLVTALLLPIALCGIAYLGAALFAVRRAAVTPPGGGGALPPITILKPLHGLEVELFENLCSFCEQDYPVFQVVFGVQRRDDPAIPVARAVMERYAAALDIAFVIDEMPLGGNPKMANVAKMMRVAKHELLTIVDADMRVDPHYLRAVADAFEDEDVGAATSLYVGSPRDGVASELAALQINDQFTPSVLVALLTQPLAFCFGSTMAVRRRVLEEIGGIDALRAHLGDDYILGSLVHRRGYRVALCRYVVHNVVRESGIPSLWLREVRWQRVIRAQRPLGHAFSFITFPLPFALLVLVLGNIIPGCILTAATLALRYAVHESVRSHLVPPCHPERRRRRTGVEGPRPNISSAWLIPVRDVLGLAVWTASFFGRGVRWHRQDLRA
jgi:ceramide glucosyltransferase